MPVRSRLVQAGVGHNHQLVPDRIGEGGNAPVLNPVGIPSCRTGFVFVSVGGDSEHNHAPDTGIRRFPSQLRQRLGRVLILAGHGRNLYRFANPVTHEYGQDQLFRAPAGFRHQATHRHGGAQPAGTHKRGQAVGQCPRGHDLFVRPALGFGFTSPGVPSSGSARSGRSYP